MFGHSLSFGGHVPHPGHGLQQPQQTQRVQQQRLRLRAAAVSAAAAAATAGAAGLHLHQQRARSAPLQHRQQQQQRLLIPRGLAEVICGAFAEIVQVAALYPVDTLKVRCQASGLSVREVVRQLFASPGGPAQVVRQLYAGVMGASLMSVAVGSLYYCTFCAARRHAMKLVAADGGAGAGTAAAAAAAGSAAAAAEAGQWQQHRFPHGEGYVDLHDPVMAATAAAEQQQRRQRQQQQQQQQSSCSGPEGGDGAGSGSSQGRLQANVIAACAAALVGALVEAPLELFKHRAQAGQIQGSLLAHAFGALKLQGPRALYGAFFLPFLFKSLPFDIGELLTYSTLQDWRDRHYATAAAAPAAAAVAARPAQPALPLGSISAAASGPAQQPCAAAAPALARVPEHVWDMAAGAAAGAAAVMISSAPDTIKTIMETGGGVSPAPGSGVAGSAAAFVATGQRLVRQHGPGGLFAGLGPRMCETVPGTMIYWLAVEQCRRLLEPYTAK